MANFIPKKLAVTSTEGTQLYGASYRQLHVKNEGATDCQIDFDREVDANSYLLESGEAITIDEAVIRLHFKTASSTTTLYTLAIK